MQGKKIQHGLKANLILKSSFLEQKLRKIHRVISAEMFLETLMRKKSIRVMVEFQKRHCDNRGKVTENKIVPLFTKYRGGGMF